MPALQMVVGMVAYAVPAFLHLAIDFRMLVDILAHHEERSLHIVLSQNSQHLRRHLGDRSVVKSQIYGLIARRVFGRTAEYPVRIQALDDIFYLAHLLLNPTLNPPAWEGIRATLYKYPAWSLSLEGRVREGLLPR